MGGWFGMAREPGQRRRTASRADRIGLRAAMADRLMPFVVGAMSFLAALALAGSIASGTLAQHWLAGARGLLTIEVPDPGNAPKAATGTAASGENGQKQADQKQADQNSSGQKNATTRAQAVLAALSKQDGIQDARRLDREEINRLLRPWLGNDVLAEAAKTGGGSTGGAGTQTDPGSGGAMPVTLPAVIVGHARYGVTPDASALQSKLEAIAPGTVVDSGTRWAARLGALTTSLRASAAVIVLVVALVAASVVAVAVRAGLAQRREAIEIIHGLGALDSDIAGQFARRAMRLSAIGGLIGSLLSLPVLLGLAALSSAFVTEAPFRAGGGPPLLPALLWATPVLFTVITAVIGWLAAQVTVRGWLRQLT